MVLSLLPAGIAAADDVITIGDVAACDGTEGLVDFNDDLGSAAPDIECIAAYGVTVGDNAGDYNAQASVTRQQMALFLARLAVQAQSGLTDIPVDTDDAFDDISGVNPAEARHAINLIADLGITQGTSSGESYNPGGLVTREQMASFIARAHDALGVDFSSFTDEGSFDDVVPGSTHADNIDRLHDAGVVQGYSDGDYRPAQSVTRGQMARFISRSIGVLEAQGLWNGQFTADVTFDVALSWINETDGAGAFRLGEPGAEGSATIAVNEADNTVAFTVDYSEVTGPFDGDGVGFHIHDGTVSEAGPVVVALATPAELEAETDQVLSGSVSVDVADFDVSDLLDDVEGYYLNLHSDGYPAGAIRGQLPDGGQDQIPAATVMSAQMTAGGVEFGNNTNDTIVVTYSESVFVEDGDQLIVNANNEAAVAPGVQTFTCGTEVTCDGTGTTSLTFQVSVPNVSVVTVEPGTATLDDTPGIVDADGNEADNFPVTFTAPAT